MLCKEKNNVVVEYALRDTKKPIGVSAYRLLEKLPAKLKGSLPTVEELEAELGGKMRPRDGESLLHRLMSSPVMVMERAPPAVLKGQSSVPGSLTAPQGAHLTVHGGDPGRHRWCSTLRSTTWSTT